MSDQRFYEEHEAEAILRQAIQEEQVGAITRERLVSMAAELGISEAALQKAEAQFEGQREVLLAEQATNRERIEYRRWRRSRFWNEASSALTASLFFSGIWYFTGRGYFWPGWIIGIAAIVTLGNLFNEVLNFSEHDFQRWKRKKAARP